MTNKQDGIWVSLNGENVPTVYTTADGDLGLGLLRYFTQPWVDSDKCHCGFSFKLEPIYVSNPQDQPATVSPFNENEYFLIDTTADDQHGGFFIGGRKDRYRLFQIGVRVSPLGCNMFRSNPNHGETEENVDACFFNVIPYGGSTLASSGYLPRGLEFSQGNKQREINTVRIGRNGILYFDKWEDSVPEALVEAANGFTDL